MHMKSQMYQEKKTYKVISMKTTVRQHPRRTRFGVVKVSQHQRNVDSLNIAQGKRIIENTINKDQEYYRKLTFWKYVFDRKKKYSKYDRNLAVKGLKNNLIPELINGYNKKHKSERVSEATRNWMAKISLGMIEGLK